MEAGEARRKTLLTIAAALLVLAALLVSVMGNAVSDAQLAQLPKNSFREKFVHRETSANTSIEYLDRQGNSIPVPPADSARRKVRVTPREGSVRSVEFHDALGKSVSALKIAELDKRKYPEYVQSYSINPEGVDFSNATVTVTAKGRTLYKCREWDYDSQTCRGEWKLFKTGLVPGENYTFTLAPGDPGFGELRVSSQAFPSRSHYLQGDNLTISGVDFNPNITVEVSISEHNLSSVPVVGYPVNISVNSTGNFTHLWMIPLNQSTHTYWIQAVDLMNRSNNNSFKVVISAYYNLTYDKLKNDSSIDSTIIDIQNVNNSLVVSFHHHAEVDKTVSVDGKINYSLTHTVLPSGVHANLTIHNYTDQYFRIRLGNASDIWKFGVRNSISLANSVKGRLNQTINSSLIIKDNWLNLIEANASSNETSPINLTIDEGTYEMRITPSYRQVRNILFKNYELYENVSASDLFLKLDDVAKNISLPNGKPSKAAFAIDPTAITFSSAVVEINASGSILYKCANWDFAAEDCLGSWSKVRALTPGELYNITITAVDPGFIEGKIDGDVYGNRSWWMQNDNVTIHGEFFLPDDIIELDIRFNGTSIAGYPINVSTLIDGNFTRQWNITNSQLPGYYSVSGTSTTNSSYNDTVKLSVSAYVNLSNATKEKEDENYSVIMTSSNLDAGILSLKFRHDAPTTQPISVQGNINYTLSNSSLAVNEIGNITIYNYTDQYFRIRVGNSSDIWRFGIKKLKKFENSVKGIGNVSINATLQFVDEWLGLVKYNETSDPYNTTIEEGTYDLRIIPSAKKIRRAMFRNYKLYDNLSSNEIFVRIDDVAKNITLPNGIVAHAAYSIDPTAIEFDEAVITVNATSNALYKCANWDFDAQDCFGPWTKVRSMVAGEEYNVTITPTDPALLEGLIAGDIFTNRSWFMQDDNVTINGEHWLPLSTVILNISLGGSLLESVSILTDLSGNFTYIWNLANNQSTDRYSIGVTQLINESYNDTQYLSIHAKTNVSVERVKEDANFGVIIDLFNDTGAGLFVKFHHDSSAKQPVTIHSRKPFNVSNTTLNPSEIGNLTIPSWDNDYFRIIVGNGTDAYQLGQRNNITINISISNSTGGNLNASMEIVDEVLNSTLHNTTSETHNKTFPEGDYNIRVVPKNHTIREITITRADVYSNLTRAVDIEILKESNQSGINLTHVYAIDPSSISFDSALVTTNATKTVLYKCVSWNFTTQSCETPKADCDEPENSTNVTPCSESPRSGWHPVANITPGQLYNITLNSTDPGFGEQDSLPANGTPDNASEYTSPDGQENVTYGSFAMTQILDGGTSCSDSTCWGTGINNPQQGLYNEMYQEFGFNISSLNISGSQIVNSTVILRACWSGGMDGCGHSDRPEFDTGSPGYAQVEIFDGNNWTSVGSAIDLGHIGSSSAMTLEEYSKMRLGNFTNDLVDIRGFIRFRVKTYGTFFGGSYDVEMFTDYVELQLAYTNESVAHTSMANLTAVSSGNGWIHWQWANPSSLNYSIIYLNGTNVANTSNNYYIATGLDNNTNYTLDVNVLFTDGFINETNVTSIASTKINETAKVFTNRSYFAQGDSVRINASGIVPFSTVEVMLSLDDNVVAGFPRNVTSGEDGKLSTIWNVSASQATDAYFLEATNLNNSNYLYGKIVINVQTNISYLKIKEDTNFAVIIDYVNDTPPNLAVTFHHDSPAKQPISIKGDVNYTLTNTSSWGDERVNLTIFNWSSNYFRIVVGNATDAYEFGQSKAVSVGGKVKNKLGAGINTTLEVIDSLLRTVVYNETLVEHNATFNESEYDTRYFFYEGYVQKTVFNGIYIGSNFTNFIEINETNESGKFDIVYNFESAFNGTAVIEASGSDLFACTKWNSSTQTCEGRWKKTRDLAEGNAYNVSLVSLMPGNTTFAENTRKLAVVDKDNFFLDYNESVSANRSGLLDIEVNVFNASIRKIEIYGYNESNSSNDFRFQNSTNETGWEKTYSLDPSALSFDNATITVNATGTDLYKCDKWNFTNQSCAGNWTLFKSNLVQGELYNFTLNSTDPGFAESSAVDLAIAPLDSETFVAAWVDRTERDISFRIMHTNGTVSVDTFDIETNINLDSRISAAAINSTHFIIMWSRSSFGTKQANFRTFVRDGTSAVPETIVDTNIGNAHDLSVAEMGGRFITCYANDNDNDADFKMFSDAGAAVVGETSVDDDIAPNAGGQNLVECSSINQSNTAYIWYEHDLGNPSNVTFTLLDRSGIKVIDNTVLDTNVGSNAQVATASLAGDKFAFLWFDATAQKVNFAIRNNTGGIVAPSFELEGAPGDRTRLALTAVRENRTSTRDHVTAVWWKKQTFEVRAQVFNDTGSNITQIFTIGTQQSHTDRLIDVAGRDASTNNEICPGTFVVAFSNSSSEAVFNTFHINGSEWNGICQATRPPEIRFINFTAFINETENTTVLNESTLRLIDNFRVYYNVTDTDPIDTLRFFFRNSNGSTADTCNSFNSSIGTIGNLQHHECFEFLEFINGTTTSTVDKDLIIEDGVELTRQAQNQFRWVIEELYKPVFKNYPFNASTVHFNRSLNLTRNRTLRFLTDVTFIPDDADEYMLSAHFNFTEGTNRTLMAFMCNATFPDGMPVTNSTNCVFLDSVLPDEFREQTDADFFFTNNTISKINTLSNVSIFFIQNGEENESRYYFPQVAGALNALEQNKTFYSQNLLVTTVDSVYPLTMTLDLHWFYEADTCFEFFLSANDTLGNTANSSLQQFCWQNFGDNQPPGNPVVRAPTADQVISGVFTLQWLDAVDPDGDDYNISIFLINPDENTINFTIALNNVSAGIQQLDFNTTQVPDGKYRLNITQTDIFNTSGSTLTVYTFVINNSLQAANITATKVPERFTVERGATFNYTINITNQGPGKAFDITLFEFVKNSTFVSSDPNNTTNGTWFLGNLTSSQTVQVNFTITVDSGFSGIIENVFNITFLNESSDEVNLSIAGDNVTVIAFNGTNLSVDKFIVESDKLVNGTAFNYTINITNLGPGNATDITVFEQFPSNLTFISSNPNNTTENSWYLGNFSVNESRQINITVRINESFSNGALENIINVTFINGTGDTVTQSFAGQNATLFNGTNLSVDKFFTENDKIINGSVFNYTINITNLGPGNATDITVFEQFAGNLTFINSTPNNTTSNSWYLGNFSVGEFRQVNITLRVNESFTNGLLENVINITFQNGTNDTVSQSFAGTNVTIFNGTNLSVDKFPSSSSVLSGSSFNFTINISNDGPGNATDVIVVEQFDPNITFINSTPNNTTSNSWYLGNLSPGEFVQLNITVRINENFTGILENIINISFVNATNQQTNLTIAGGNTTVAEVQFFIGFSITLPGKGPINITNLTGNTASNQTSDIEFNSSNSTHTDVEPCVVGTADCQNATDPIFLFQNTGTVNLSWIISLNATLPGSIFLKAGTTRNASNASNITTESFILNSSIASEETENGFLFADFIGALFADTTTRRITHNGTA